MSTNLKSTIAQPFTIVSRSMEDYRVSVDSSVALILTNVNLSNRKRFLRVGSPKGSVTYFGIIWTIFPG
jgi:hypothetical protein